MVISFGIFVGVTPLGIGDATIWFYSIIGFFLAGIFAFLWTNAKGHLYPRTLSPIGQ